MPDVERVLCRLGRVLVGQGLACGTIYLGVLAGLAAAGCAGHAARTQSAREALDRDDPQRAVREFNRQLGVKNAAEQLPELKKDLALFALDRATVLQQMRQYRLSSRDLEAADKRVEILDFSRNGGHELGRYLFSDDVGPYKAPAYEKLMINALNMVNYLARGDLSGARVEARRFAVMQKYLDEAKNRQPVAAVLGNYLAGFVFEKSGQPDEALRYYSDALAARPSPSLQTPVLSLGRQLGYDSVRLAKILGNAATITTASSTATTECEAPQGCGELLVVVAYGRVPPKIARRIPIGLALTYASVFLAPAMASKAAYLAGQGLVTWVNFPQLAPTRGSYNPAVLHVDAQSVATEPLIEVDLEARKAWDAVRGQTIAAAIVRTITRAALGEGARRASGGGWVGALVSLGGQAALTAADTPDTRSWSTLPARIAIARRRVPAGDHLIDLQVRGLQGQRKITVAANGWAVASFVALR